MADDVGLTDALTKVPQRIASLIELLTTLDQRVITALDSLEEMKTSIATVEGIGGEGELLVGDLRDRLDRLDARLNRDMDEVKAKFMEQLDGIGPRLDRLEEAIFNIERATVNLDRAFEGGLEMLPDFVSKRLKGEGKKVAPAPVSESPPTLGEPGN